MSDCKDLQEKREIAKRALVELEKQQIAFGLHTPPYIKEGIYQNKQLIQSIQKEMDALGCDARPPDSNLPRRQAFFGREKEMIKVLEALSPEERGWGVVIDGIGGIGKTAMAVEAAYRCQEEALFDLFLFTTAKRTRLQAGGEQALPDSAVTLDEMLGEIARLLGRPRLAQRTAEEKPEALRQALQDEVATGLRILLIFDNLESLTQGEQQAIYGFLRRLPNGCKAIITSRRRAGENAVWVRLGKLDWAASRQIILDRMRHSWRLQRNLNAAGQERWRELYDAAGGSPLALRWLLGLMDSRNLSLDRTLAIMRSADDEDTPLHEFIYREARAEMGLEDWRTLGALSLFVTPASFDALVAITGFSRTQLESTLERLDAFSLVDNEGPEGPYTLHPLTRRLAAKELAAQPQLADSLQNAYVTYWLDYAQRYGGEGKDAYKTFDRLEEAWPNLETAASLLWARTGLPAALQDAEAARQLIRLAYALSQFLWFRGYWNERVRLGTWQYEAGRAREEWQDAGWGAYRVAFIHYTRGETAQARTWTDRMAAAMERGGTRRDRAIATRMQGLAARQQGDLTAAEKFLTTALEEFRILGEEADEAITLNSLGKLMHQRKKYIRAEGYYRQALTLAKKLEKRELIANYTGNLAALALARGRWQDARAWVERALPLAQEVGRKELVASDKYRLARVLEVEGAVAEALPLAEEALRIYHQLELNDSEAETRELITRLRQKLAQGGG